MPSLPLTYENDSYAPVALYPSSQRRKPKYAGLLLFSIFLSLAGTVMIPIANAQQPQRHALTLRTLNFLAMGPIVHLMMASVPAVPPPTHQ